MKTLRVFLGLCEHEWQLLNTLTLSKRNYITKEYVTIGYEYVQKCKKCQNIRIFKV